MRLPACPPRAILLKGWFQAFPAAAAALPQADLRPPERRNQMLQAVHVNQRATQASSLYGQWILVERGESKCLVAVWIDSAMRVFEKEFSGHFAWKHATTSEVNEVTFGEVQESEDGLAASALQIEEKAATS